MNRRKVHCVIEYIKSLAEFPFDAADVEEDVAAVVAHFGFNGEFTLEELDIVRADLLPLGLQAELAEVARVLDECAEAPLAGVREPSWAELLIFRAQARKSPVQIAAVLDQLLKRGAV